MRDAVRRGILPGALAGLAGGVAFGLTMVDLGTLDSIATIVRADPSSAIAWLVHMLIAAIVGAAFGALVYRQRLGAGETLFTGLAYGAFFWFVGPLTLRPILAGGSVAWTVEAAQRAVPALFGHIVYGVVLGLAYALVRGALAGSWRRWSRPGRLLRGTAAGLAAAALLGPTLGGEHSLVRGWTGLDSSDQWVVALVYGAVAGIAYVLLQPNPAGPAGPSLVRGVAYGFLLWVGIGLALLPVLAGDELAWTVAGARAGFAAFPAHVLFGVAIAVLAHWLGRLGRLLFSDDPRVADREGGGTHAARALGRGIVAGLVGGALFTPVWLLADTFPNVAGLVGGSSTGLGIFLHFLIAEAIGVAFALLFRRQCFDAGSALGYGLAYGFFWWVLGPLTLLPEFLGAGLRWDADLAAGAFPGLVGHLFYGAGLALIVYRSESLHNPWWITRNEAEAGRQQQRRDQLLSAAPAVWALVALVALTLPVLLAGDGPAVDPGDLYGG